MSILAEDLALGDLVILKTGDKVPADIRLIESTEMKVRAHVHVHTQPC